jgi:hypothetical protein
VQLQEGLPEHLLRRVRDEQTAILLLVFIVHFQHGLAHRNHVLSVDQKVNAGRVAHLQSSSIELKRN